MKQKFNLFLMKSPASFAFLDKEAWFYKTWDCVPEGQIQPVPF